MNRHLTAEALTAIQKGSEVKEQPAEELVEEEVVKRQRPRKQYRNFSVNFEIEDYNSFQTYLNENGIASGSGFIRDMLREKGII